MNAGGIQREDIDLVIKSLQGAIFSFSVLDITDIFDEIEAALKKISANLKAKCVGGGRIQHDANDKKIKVYGYSQGFGKANHEVSVSILKKKYSDYDITWSDEGY